LSLDITRSRAKVNSNGDGNDDEEKQSGRVDIVNDRKKFPCHKTLEAPEQQHPPGKPLGTFVIVVFLGISGRNNSD
jgi:hypothetical protein